MCHPTPLPSTHHCCTSLSVPIMTPTPSSSSSSHLPVLSSRESTVFLAAVVAVPFEGLASSNPPLPEPDGAQRLKWNHTETIVHLLPLETHSLDLHLCLLRLSTLPRTLPFCDLLPCCFIVGEFFTTNRKKDALRDHYINLFFRVLECILRLLKCMSFSLPFLYHKHFLLILWWAARPWDIWNTLWHAAQVSSRISARGCFNFPGRTNFCLAILLKWLSR